jgi:hypothetical protein
MGLSRLPHEALSVESNRVLARERGRMANDDEELVPDADLLESMRAVGYSLETAIADLIDNSLAASAKNIWVNFETIPEAHVSILDDGNGMDRATLRTAMKLAGKPPSAARAKDDLGRFGLGLKTASLSQCRNLTVTSKTENSELISACWDLDHIQITKKWLLKWPKTEEVENFPSSIDLFKLGHGTQVLWRNLDLLMSTADVESDEFTELKVSVANHLSLVFHRYMQQIGSARVRMYVNGEEVKPLDPFLEASPGTLQKDEIKIKIKGETVIAKPFILPDQNKLTAAQRKSSTVGDSFRDSQGFYIYRNKRLLSYGTWFRLAPKSEVAKLARVRVDTPNSLDKEWRLGIMKSSVQPPKVLRERLRAIVPRIIGDSQRVTRGKNLLAIGTQKSAWLIKELGGGAFSLEVNLEYPALRALDSDLSANQRRSLKLLLDSLERLFPFNELIDRFSTDQGLNSKSENFPVGELFTAILGLSNGDHELAFQLLLQTPPVSTTPGLKAAVEADKSKYMAQINEEDQ